MLYQNILQTISKTPLVKLNKFSAKQSVEIFAKIEGINPGGSIKDRIALKMIESAEKSDELTKDKIILESTSGNTGIALAMIGAFKNYKVEIVMSESMSDERKKLLKALGAKLILTNKNLGYNGAILKAQKLFNQNPQKYWYANQYENQNNILAHYQTTAQEIIDDLPDLTMLIAGMGTCGTIIGIAKKLKKYNSKIKIIGADVYKNHTLQGLKSTQEKMLPKIYDEKLLDEKILVKDKNAIQTVKFLAKNEGILTGMSAGAPLWIAKQKSKILNNQKIVVIIPDRSEKYLSANLFE